MITFFEAMHQSDFFGKAIFMALFSLSLISWSFLIYYTIMLKAAKKAATSFLKGVKAHQGCLLTINSTSKLSFKGIALPSPFHQLFVSTKSTTKSLLDKNQFFLRKYPKDSKSFQNHLCSADIQMIESSLYSTMTTEKAKLEKYFFVLSTIVPLAPFLGLLGTVWGILTSFSQMQSSLSGGSNLLMLGGLSMALTTTVLGLLIAIPALIGNNFLKNMTRQISVDMQDFAQFLVSTVELQYRKVDLS
ncbi:TolQ protein [Candidatus Aerophobetes bacterium]|uniref:TolQ protein n=1 Tax=Aerophobetes bacterium TaxID=2030807 RepID=A0A2A4X3C5_UNCAE|nr:MAG: TolQ protein [Candidatus Aerophobetes bacterium]